MSKLHTNFLKTVDADKQELAKHRFIGRAFELLEEALESQGQVAALRAAGAVERLHKAADSAGTDDAQALVFQLAARESGRALEPLKEKLRLRKGADHSIYSKSRSTESVVRSSKTRGNTILTTLEART